MATPCTEPGITGACNCGSVSFRLDAISDVYVCHCSICRRSASGAGFAVGIVSKDQFHWLGSTEPVTTWTKPGHDWQTSFCKICGSSLPGENDDKRMYVPVGLLESDHDALTVAHHIYVDSRAGWEVICDSGVQHPEAFGSGGD